MAELILKNRIPFEYFITTGKGSSNLEIHAGSYHAALYDAKICNFNIQTYSSVIPETAKEISIDVVKDISFGSELYTIMSCAHGKKDEYISCGIIYGNLINSEGQGLGSLVCEVSGNYKEDNLKERLKIVLDDLHKKTYKDYEINNIKMVTNSYVSNEKHGTCIVALCFVSFTQY